MGSRKRKTGLALITTAGILGVACAATLTIGSAGAAPDSTGSHCAGNVDNDEQKCFDTQAEAEAYAAQRIKDGAGSAQTGVEQPTDVVIGTLFENWRFGGASLTLWGSRPCNDDDTAEFYYNLPQEWQGKVSAVQGWAECDVVLHDKPYIEGEGSQPFPQLTPVIDGPWNDIAQSVEFR
ncbi:hypothetical protein EES43_27790 [Streptomyces sp. ADI96-02]|uniref:hypothetical protein n=1 Tax=unclassified Streptomyces TaxID=2593676 RepID=UPI000F553CC3|nr:hypothetical protein [Streptomyces sp. ADI96-02]RPK54872.1 hypothetical protein EES43_27790 [Streptomyces sp. ADI96-02]